MIMNNKRLIAIEHDLAVFGSNPRFASMVSDLRKEYSVIKHQANNEKIERSLHRGVKIGSLIKFEVSK